MIGVAGATLGFAVGCGLGFALIAGATAYPAVAPYRQLLVLLVVMPFAAILAAVATTPMRLSVTRRAA